MALSIAISHDHTNHTILLLQTIKINNLVGEYRQLNAHTVDTLMISRLQLQQPEKSVPVPADITGWVNRTPYCPLVGSLM